MQIVPLSLVFTAQPVNTPHGQAFTAQVKLQDSFGNGIAGVPIDLAIGSGGAKIYDTVQDYSNNANPNGPWIYGSVQGLSGAGFATFTTNLPATTCTNPPGGQCWTNGLGFLLSPKKPERDTELAEHLARLRADSALGRMAEKCRPLRPRRQPPSR